MVICASTISVMLLCEGQRNLENICASVVLTASSRMCCSWCVRAFPLQEQALKVMELVLGPVAFNALCRTKPVMWLISYFREKKIPKLSKCITLKKF